MMIKILYDDILPPLDPETIPGLSAFVPSFIPVWLAPVVALALPAATATTAAAATAAAAAAAAVVGPGVTPWRDGSSFKQLVAAKSEIYRRNLTRRYQKCPMV